MTEVNRSLNPIPSLKIVGHQEKTEIGGFQVVADGVNPIVAYFANSNEAQFFCDAWNKHHCRSEISVDAEMLSDVVDEYLHWRKVNPHIKGGENYLKRLRAATREPVSSDLNGAIVSALKSALKSYKPVYQQFVGEENYNLVRPPIWVTEGRKALEEAGVSYAD